MNMTPLDIRNQEFRKKTLGGVDPEEVHAFLGQVAAEYELRTREAQETGDKLKLAKEQLSHFHSIESTLQETALTLQKVLEEKKAEALKEAEFIIAEAKNNAYKETEAIRRESEKLRTEIVGLRAQKAAFFSRIRNALRTQEELLQAMERDELDAEDSQFEIGDHPVQPSVAQGRIKRQAVKDIRAPGPGLEAQAAQPATSAAPQAQAQATQTQQAPAQAQPAQSAAPQAAAQAAQQSAPVRPQAASQPVQARPAAAPRRAPGPQSLPEVESTGMQIEIDKKPRPSQ